MQAQATDVRVGTEKSRLRESQGATSTQSDSTRPSRLEAALIAGGEPEPVTATYVSGPHSRRGSQGME